MLLPYWSLGPLRLTVLEYMSKYMEQVLILEPRSHENMSSVTSIQTMCTYNEPEPVSQRSRHHILLYPEVESNELHFTCITVIE